MIKQLLFTDTINPRMADTLPLREGHPANTDSGCNSRQKLFLDVRPKSTIVLS